MESLSFASLEGGLIALPIATAALVWRSRHRLAADSFFGPLPEEEAERAELTDKERYDPARSGQVTPGAVTPPSAGSPEAFSEAAGVGPGGPQHLSGPPPVAAGTTPSHPSSSGWREDGDWSTETDSGNKQWRAAAVAGAGAVAGLTIAAFLRRRVRRRGRVERLRAQARRAKSIANSAAVAGRDRAAALQEAMPDTLDPKAGAGGGLALLTAVAGLVAIRRWQRESEARRAAVEAAARAEAARKRGLLGLKLGGDWLNRQRSRLDGVTAVSDRLPGQVRSWAAVFGGLVLSALGIAIVRRVVGHGPARTGAMVADAAPAREPPIAP